MDYLDLLAWLAENPILSAIFLLVQYIVIMLLRDKTRNKLLMTAATLWFIPQDVVVNIVFMSIIGMELPQEWLVTDRLKRWKKITGLGRMNHLRHEFGWRVCNMLNRWDEGHC